jgi:hypothetical protein
VEEDSMTKNNFYQYSICHEVKYDPTNKKSDTYKKVYQTFLLWYSWAMSIKTVPRIST